MFSSCPQQHECSKCGSTDHPRHLCKQSPYEIHRDICQRWNANNGCRSDNCPRRHVCLNLNCLLQDHPQYRCTVKPNLAAVVCWYFNNKSGCNIRKWTKLHTCVNCGSQYHPVYQCMGWLQKGSKTMPADPSQSGSTKPDVCSKDEFSRAANLRTRRR